MRVCVCVSDLAEAFKAKRTREPGCRSEMKSLIDARYWEVCVDAGEVYLRYVGDNMPGFEPVAPVHLNLGGQSPWGLMVEAFNLLGIPAAQA